MFDYVHLSEASVAGSAGRKLCVWEQVCVGTVF